MAVVIPVTSTGVAEANPSTVGLPSWPPPLPSGSPVSRPQHCTLPLARTAHAWKPPPLTATAPVTPTTDTAVGLGVCGGLLIPPRPSWPYRFAHHPRRVVS